MDGTIVTSGIGDIDNLKKEAYLKDPVKGWKVETICVGLMQVRKMMEWIGTCKGQKGRGRGNRGKLLDAGICSINYLLTHSHADLLLPTILGSILQGILINNVPA